MMLLRLVIGRMLKLENISNYHSYSRVKVDLTKYIEEHLFRFDSAFGEEVNNQSVMLL